MGRRRGLARVRKLVATTTAPVDAATAAVAIAATTPSAVAFTSIPAPTAAGTATPSPVAAAAAAAAAPSPVAAATATAAAKAPASTRRASFAVATAPPAPSSTATLRGMLGRRDALDGGEWQGVLRHGSGQYLPEGSVR